jgi:protein-S-isoprenylcysteine O-methyltransferase Ste14
MIFYINLGIFAGFWLISMASCVMAIKWSFFGGRRRILPAAILSLLALIIGCLGSTRFHLTWETWTNGQLQYHYDTRWFFIAPLVLGSFALACTVWQKVRSSHAAQPEH